MRAKRSRVWRRSKNGKLRRKRNISTRSSHSRPLKKTTRSSSRIGSLEIFLAVRSSWSSSSRSIATRSSRSRFGHERTISHNPKRSNKMILHIYTIIHTLISLVAIFTGFVVLFGLLAGNRVDGWTKWFLITAVLTTVTGFFFPFHGFTPAIGLGIISLPFLALTIFARYRKNLAGGWRWIYIVGAVICLYFNLFVLVVQSFEKIPALHALAPTQTESPFKLTQLVVLTISALLCIVALIRFRPEPARVT